jgi:5'-3' exonuclease
MMAAGGNMRHLLLDGYNLMHRARFGMRNGEHYVIFNFFRSLRPLVEQFAPCKVTLFLEGVPQHRTSLDGAYKGNRVTEPGTKQHDELVEFRKQKRVILDLLKYLPVDMVKHEHLECDDAIGSWVLAHRDTDECVVVSTDTDFIQLLGHPNVKLYNPVRKEFVEPAPYDYVLWKALRGDKTDNIPAVEGITDGKATKICADSKLLENLRCDPDKAQQLDRNLTLVAFKYTELNDPGYSRVHPSVDYDALKAAFTDMGFYSMVNTTSWPKYCKTFDSVYK